MIEVDGLQKSYGATRAVEDISLTVGEGEIFGILGPNGAGKTTAVECISGLRTGDAGSVRVDGLDPWRDRDSVSRVLGVQLQDSQLQPKITVREALELWTQFYDDPEPWPALAGRLGLTDRLGTRFAKLSGGQQQRLAIALALIGRPKVVILDELTTGLDPGGRRDTWQLVREVRDSGVTVALVTHSMEEAQSLCDRIAIIVDGRVRALDTPDALVRRAGAATVTSFETTVRTGDPVGELSALAGVIDVRHEGARTVVEGTEGSAVQVLGHLTARGADVRRLRVVDGSLDQAYLAIIETGDEAGTDSRPDLEEIS